MKTYQYVTLRECLEIKDSLAEWFHSKWGVPKDAYLKCMDAYLSKETEYGWYLCLDDGKIIGGMGVIENDFHDRKDLTQIFVQFILKRHIGARVLQEIC